MSMNKYIIVGIAIIAIFFCILGLDAWLSILPDWPTLSQTVIYWSGHTHLVPFFIGFITGGLAIHWFES